VGKNVIRVCGCLPCDLKDAQGVIGSIKGSWDRAGTDHGRRQFTLEVVGCIGACDQAPAMMINDTLYGKLTPARIAEILESYK
jgi:NADH-quinone oxidoreductase subunit E